jgi:YD repeat-containing protein
MNDPQMNDILARLNSVGTKPTDPNAKSSNSAGDPAMHSILSKFAAVSGTQSALKTPGQLALAEGLGAEQKRVGQVGPTDMPDKKKDHPFKGQLVGEDSNPVDTVTMDVPLMIRMFEYAREEAKSDMDLHDVAEKLIALGTGGGTLTMDNYEDIVSNVENGIEDHEMDEAAGEKFGDEFYAHDPAGRSTPTVDGYHQTRDLETGSYTDYTDRGPISTQTTYDKSGQMTSQHAQARVGDQTMARSRFYPKKNESEELRKLAGLATEDYVGGREAPQDLVKSLSKSYRDFVKEVEQQSAAQPDRELRSKKEKPRKFGNILGEE